MRKTFINTVLRLAEQDENIHMLTADTGFTILDAFREKFPSRYLNVGIAEATMIGVSAGLALSGKTVFCYAIVPFVTMRCFEQVRIDLCYQNLPVKLIGVGEGFTYGTAGATHHAIEDIALMRALPNMTVICPGDPFEVEKAVEESLKLKGPCYIRLGKVSGESLRPHQGAKFKIGRGNRVKEGNGLALISTGSIMETAARVREKLVESGLDPELISMHTVKPIDKEMIIDLAGRCRIIATLEEHNVIGGLGSAVGDVILENELPVRLVKFAIPDCFVGEVGTQSHLQKCFGLSEDQIVERLRSEFNR